MEIINMKIGFLLFEQYHQRKNIGSSRIRGHWLVEQIPEAELFQQGKDYDVVVYQKVYWKEHARNFKGLKILDLCDPDWLDGAEVVNFLNDIDVVTVSSLSLKREIERMTKKPVYFIQDGVRMKDLPQPKKHKGKAEKACWFGYSGNLEVIYPTFFKVKKMGLTLRIISDGDLKTSECQVENVRWKEDTVDKYIQECDFCLLPESTKGRFKFKSNNKTVQSWALGMPVAKTAAQLEEFMDPDARQEEASKRYEEVVRKCDVKQSAAKLMEIINKHVKRS